MVIATHHQIYKKTDSSYPYFYTEHSEIANLKNWRFQGHFGWQGALHHSTLLQLFHPPGQQQRTARLRVIERVNYHLR